MIGNLFLSFEQLLLNFTTKHLGFLIVLFFVFLLSLLFHIYLLRKRFNVDDCQNEFKKFNIETEHMVKLRMIKSSYLILYLSAATFIILRDNISLMIPILSGLILVFVFAIRELLNNLILGLFFKSSLTTTVSEGMVFSFEDDVTKTYEVVKINMFKTIIKCKSTGVLESIENNDMNKRRLVHKPIKNQRYISFRFVVHSKYDLKKYCSSVSPILDNLVRESKIDFDAIKKDIYRVKSKYGQSPHLKPFYDISFKYLNKNEIEIVIDLVLYGYDYSSYRDDFFRLKP